VSTPLRFAALLSCALLLPAPAHAQGRVRRTFTFVAGAAAGLVVHEGGHILTGAAVGARPGFKRLDYGVIPFFVITHDQVSRRREYLISSAGFFAQHAANEWLLGERSTGKARGAFQKGWLTFNLATSAVYTTAAIGRFGAPERDTRGMALSAGADGMPEPVIGVLVLVPAALDGVRLFTGDPAWARWASRAAKAGLVLIAIR